MKSILEHALIIALGGALGALLRYGTAGLAYRLFGESFPWGTLTVNVLGSFAIGLLWGMSDWSAISSQWRTFVFIGFLGSFTTFSTFSMETLALFQDGEIMQAGANIFLNIVLGIVLAWVGFMMGEYLSVVAGGR